LREPPARGMVLGTRTVRFDQLHGQRMRCRYRKQSRRIFGGIDDRVPWIPIAPCRRDWMRIDAGTDFSDALWTCKAIDNSVCPTVSQGAGALDARIDLPAESLARFVLDASSNVGVQTPVSTMAEVIPTGSNHDPDVNKSFATDFPDRRDNSRDGFEWTRARQDNRPPPV